MGFRVGRSTDHDSTKRARDATRRRATARGTSAHAKPSADDFERSFARHAGRDVRNVRGSPCGGRARGIPNRRRAVRVRAGAAEDVAGAKQNLDPGMVLLRLVRDESHAVALGAHRRRRRSALFREMLDASDDGGGGGGGERGGIAVAVAE